MDKMYADLAAVMHTANKFSGTSSDVESISQGLANSVRNSMAGSSGGWLDQFMCGEEQRFSSAKGQVVSPLQELADGLHLLRSEYEEGDVQAARKSDNLAYLSKVDYKIADQIIV
ncbi:hypothetical protein ACWDV4_06555 [Micromonospora sp. NPDC003197]